MSPEVEQSFDNTYSVTRGQPFDVRALRDGRNV